MRESHTLDGRTIFEWRAEYADMVTQFITYADHQPHCIVARAEHWHARLAGWDKRTICHASPCTCGVLIILMLLAPEQKWIRPCPDEPVLLPVPNKHRTRPVLNPDGTQLHIFNIPVVEAEPDEDEYCVYTYEKDCLARAVKLNMPAFCTKPHHVPNVPETD